MLEDWIWHVALPLLSYAILLAAALTLTLFSTTALFLTGAVTLILLFVGIHNAWDTVTLIVVKRLSGDKSEGEA